MDARPCKIPSNAAETHLATARSLARNRGGSEHRVGSAAASHCVACQPPFRSGPPVPPTEEACTRTPAAALKAKLCGLSLQTHRPVERGPRDRARTENVLWHGSHHAMGTAARPGLSLPVHVSAGRVTTLQSREFCAGRWADAPRVRDRRSLGLLLCPALNMRGVHR
jgi:hypothetical protein